MKFLVVLIISTLLFVSQAQPSQEQTDAVTKCLTDTCLTSAAGVGNATTEQKIEHYKFEKCTNGQKSDDDTDDVAASVTQDSKCTAATTYADRGECQKACGSAHYTGENPYIAFNDCQIECYNSTSARQLGFSLVLLAIVLALF